MEAIFPKLDVPPGPMGIVPVTIQMGLYGYILFIAANLVGDGAGLLMLCPSLSMLAGSIILPILGAVPDGMMVLCSGLGPREEAQSQVSIGVGALAGSTIMLLTLPWFLAVIAGRVSIGENGPTYNKPPNAPHNWNKLMPAGDMSLTRTGVSISATLRKSAKIMLCTSLSYLVIQGPAFTVDKTRSWQAKHKDLAMYQEELLKEAHSEQHFALAGLVMCCIFFLGYLILMWKDAQKPTGSVQNAIVQANVQAIKDGHCTLRGAMVHFREKTNNKGLQEELINKKDTGLEIEVKRMCSVLTPFFGSYDLNGDGKMSLDEFRLVMKDLRENVSGEMMKRIFEAADMDNNNYISFEEFVACMLAFAMDPNDMLLMSGNAGPEGTSAVVRIPTQSAYMGAAEEGGEETQPEEEDMPEDLADLPPEEQQRRIKHRAFYQMAVGTCLVLLFSDPMCDTLGLFADQIHVNKFYVSFVLAPLASNASELAGAMNMARVKTASSMTASLSSLLGAGIMNNTFCLAIFLVLIIWKKLAWQFTAETISILVIEVIMTFFVLCFKTQRLVHAWLILSLYPMALGIVYLLENQLNLD